MQITMLFIENMNIITSSERDLIIGMVSLAIFVVIIIIIIFGYVCNKLWWKHKHQTEASDDTHSHLPGQHHTEENLELTENVSYGPLSGQIR